jgi:predicted nucleotidyltransferase
MVVDNADVNRAIACYVADVKKAMNIDKVYLYGSYAKGTHHASSDVDLCFFSSDFENQRSVDVLARLIGMTRGYGDIDIEPRAFPTSAIGEDNPFVKEVIRTGKEIL